MHRTTYSLVGPSAPVGNLTRLSYLRTVFTFSILPCDDRLYNKKINLYREIMFCTSIVQGYRFIDKLLMLNIILQ